eukprot:3740660-Amphidinium_carterae.1
MRACFVPDCIFQLLAKCCARLDLANSTSSSKIRVRSVSRYINKVIVCFGSFFGCESYNGQNVDFVRSRIGASRAMAESQISGQDKPRKRQTRNRRPPPKYLPRQQERK